MAHLTNGCSMGSVHQNPMLGSSTDLGSGAQLTVNLRKGIWGVLGGWGRDASMLAGNLLPLCCLRACCRPVLGPCAVAIATLLCPGSSALLQSTAACGRLAGGWDLSCSLRLAAGPSATSNVAAVECGPSCCNERFRPAAGCWSMDGSLLA